MVTIFNLSLAELDSSHRGGLPQAAQHVGGLHRRHRDHLPGGGLRVHLPPPEDPDRHRPDRAGKPRRRPHVLQPLLPPDPLAAAGGGGGLGAPRGPLPRLLGLSRLQSSHQVSGGCCRRRLGNIVSFRGENLVGEANPCVGYPECQTEFNGTLVPYHTNDTCSVQEFSKCQDKCPEASCQFVKYTQNQVEMTFHYKSLKETG